MTIILDGFRHVMHAMRVAAHAAQAQAGLSAAQLFVLHKLADVPASSLNELAARTHTHQSSVSVVVQRLVERGLVVRGASASDARRLELRLSPAGRARLKHAPDPVQERWIAAIVALPLTRRQSLALTLAALTESLELPGHTAPAMFFEDKPPLPNANARRVGGRIKQRANARKGSSHAAVRR